MNMFGFLTGSQAPDVSNSIIEGRHLFAFPFRRRLRRAVATRLCEAGASLKVAQYLLGHEDINMTANAHATVQGNLTASEMLKLIERGEQSSTTFS